MTGKKTIWFFMVMVFVLPAAAYVLISWYQKTYASLPVLGPTKEVNGKKQPHAVGQFAFINQDDQPVTHSAWNNKIVVANFFFTHCPVVCPKMTNSLQRVHDTYRDNDEIVINSFTVDPERDSAAQLNAYARRYDIRSGNWQLLTGDKKDLYRFARNELMLVATDGDGGPEDFIHSEKLVLIDKQSRIRGYYDGTNESAVNQLIKDIKRLNHEK